ncbi:similar to Saccharomyces cerevisiae YIL146C ATG32 Mitochondrial-anchored transmembrane receptor that interacts with the autophagy adaptor protein [Maudiozyma saulgeensis]|uniref:Similar to Saccharomyces cerevisiae YIL146C ATG32 Mitochondrial-anchored transmembrane receptor that interacts with the autophagy adaptor protein n=1 Tax=Maudiozyma saulgeensis TaxID=1789683 RepID=A0A1X7QXH1_9SACH|nr:similar to Saccharomyces cerevisiae YIL146C ATG32 Mitochondrial-anchored transmembrane receptor that interacts with the autophagy adaptor protein [Kazachstania saulgeensis]
MSVYQNNSEKDKTNSNINSLDPHHSIYDLLERSHNILPLPSERLQEEIKNEHLKNESDIFSGETSSKVITERPLTLEEATQDDHQQDKQELPESWFAIQKNDITNSCHVERCTSQTNTVGILSSSDTSEEELDPQNSPSPNKLSVLKNDNDRNCSTKKTALLNCISSNRLNVNQLDPSQNNPFDFNQGPAKSRLPSIGFNQFNEEDSVTLTKSISSSSGSFVMPKLSISRKGECSKNDDRKNFKILILGRIGLQFYKSVPTSHDHFFFLPRTYDSNEYVEYNGIIIVIEEVSELMSILNKVSQKVKNNIPIAAITLDSDNLLQIKNVLNSYLRRGLINVMYPPIVLSNDKEVKKLFSFLSSLEEKFIKQQGTTIREKRVSSSVYVYTSHSSSDYSDSSESRGSISNKRLKRLQYQNGNKINEYILSHQEKKDRTKRKQNKSSKHRYKSVTENKWFIWGVSLSVGVGVGYCLSYFNVVGWIVCSTSTFLHPNNKDIKTITDVTSHSTSSVLNKLLKFMDREMDPDSHGIFTKSFNAVRNCVKNVGFLLKKNFNKGLAFCEEMHNIASKERKLSVGYNQDNNQSKLFALGYILL